MDDATRLGQNIARARKARRLSQWDLARLMARDFPAWRQTTVSRLEHGRRPLSILESTALQRHLSVSIWEGTQAGDPDPWAATDTRRVTRATVDVMCPVVDCYHVVSTPIALVLVDADDTAPAWSRAPRTFHGTAHPDLLPLGEHMTEAHHER